MRPLLLALVSAVPAGCVARAEVREEDGAPAGVLAAWEPGAGAPPEAAAVDPRIIDPLGAAARVSLVLVPPAVRIPFDDAAVLGARRAVLTGPPPRCVSTLVRGDSLFAGALTAAHHDDGPFDDPFARVHAARRLRVGPGLLGATPPPAGPVLERYGGANPWPWDRWAAPGR